MSALLEIRDVVVRFRVRGGVFSSAGSIDAVSGVSLDVEDHQTADHLVLIGARHRVQALGVAGRS